MSHVPVARLQELFSIDAAGRLFWKERGRGRRYGQEAGTMTSEGYRTVFFHGKHCLAHRIVFALTAGKWPENEIDHINGAPTDNRPENLREATRCKNGQNRKVSRNNTSGHKGVSWNSQAGKWEARIRAGNHIHRLGYFADIEAAASAYRRAAERLFGDFQRMAA